MERLHEIVAEPQRWFWARSCVCQSNDGASTTRSGRCQSQFEALGSGRVPPPIIIRQQNERNHEKSTMSRTAQYDWQNLGGYVRTPQSGSSLF